MTNAEKIEKWWEQHPDALLNEDILLEILGVDSLARLDLSNARLPLINLEYANLEGTDLSRAYLRNANLQSVYLRGANLLGAILRQANLREANLPEANLECASLRGANLQCASLQGANLQCARLSGANLLGADLRYARLEHTELQYANLAGAETDGILQLTGVHNYQTIVIPTERGWQINIGCWQGDLDELKKLIAQNTWVESKGEQVIKQRPYMENLIQFVESYIALKSAENREA